MNCTDMEELVSAYANGELHRTQREFVEEHLAGCPDCRADLADHTWVGARLTSLKATPISSDIKERTMLKIKAIHTTRRPVRWALRPALAVTAVAAAIIAALVLQLPTTGPGGLIAKAYAATASLQSYRMNGSTVSTFNRETLEATFEWEFAAPDRYHGNMTSAGGVSEFIIIGDEQYTRAPGNGRSSGNVVVITTEGFSVFNPVPSREGTLQLLDSLTDRADLPDEVIDGEDTLRSRGRVDIDGIMDEQLAGLDPESPAYSETLEFLELQRSIRIDVELWISKEDFSIRQMRLDVESPTTGSGGDQVGEVAYSTVVRFFDLNEPIEIERPLTASGDLVPGWDLAGSGPPAPQVQKEAVRSEGQ